jgi:hypothetical protein
MRQNLLKLFACTMFLLAIMCRTGFAQGVGSSGPIYPVYTQTVSSSLIAKSQAGWFYSFNGTTSTTGYFLVFDSATVPADGTVAPLFCYSVAANTTIATGLLNNVYMNNGIVIVFSTTGCFTKTASATAHISAQVR